MGDFFWEDLDASIAELVRELLIGRDVAQVAGKLKKSDDLLYKWANPNCEQQPSLKQFLKLMRLTGDYRPLARLAAAGGLVVAPKQGSPAAILRQLAEAWEAA